MKKYSQKKENEIISDRMCRLFLILLILLRVRLRNDMSRQERIFLLSKWVVLFEIWKMSISLRQ